MPIYALGEISPTIDPSAFVHPEAVIIGEVTIGAESSIWPCAVLRGDSGGIVVGARTSIQDGAVLHCGPDLPTVVGDDCVVGHIVHLEGCTVEDGSLVGNGSIVLHRAVIGRGSVVGSGAVVPNAMVVPAGAMALGVPAKVREGAAADRGDLIRGSAATYVERARRYRQELRRIG